MAHLLRSQLRWTLTEDAASVATSTNLNGLRGRTSPYQSFVEPIRLSFGRTVNLDAQLVECSCRRPSPLVPVRNRRYTPRPQDSLGQSLGWVERPGCRVRVQVQLISVTA